MAKRNETRQDNTQTGRGNDFGVDQVPGLGHPQASSRPIENAELNQANPKRTTEVPHPGLRAPNNS